MAFGRDKIKNDLKKAIYKAIAKAYKQNIPFVKEAVDSIGKEHAVNHIIADLDDPNNVAEVPENHIPVDKDNVLHKDIPSVKEMHDAKQDQAKAKMGIMPLEGQKGAVYMAEKPSKGVEKLKKFMGERELKMGKTSQHEKGVHHPVPRSNKDSGESLTGHYARKGDSLASIHDHESGREIASSLHQERLNELKQMPKPNLGKAKIDESMSPKEKSYARWKRGGDLTEGVHTAPFKSVPGMSTSGYEIELSGHPTDAAKESHKRVLSELKQMPKPNLPKSEEMNKARVDEGYLPPQKRTMREARGNEMFGRPEFAAGDPRHDRIKAIHAPAISYEKDYMGEEIPSQSEAGRALAHGDAEKAKQMHREKLTEMQSMPKPNLGKARADESLSLEDKVRARQERNIRSVKDARTPTGQKTRTARSSRRRESELELGTPHYSNFDEHGRPMRVRSVPSERRHGEKIVGEPKEMGEREGGVHIRGATYAPKHQNIGGGGPQSMGAMSEKGGKSWRSGGKYHTYGGSHLAHEDIMHAQSKIRPNLTKTKESDENWGQFYHEQEEARQRHLFSLENPNLDIETQKVVAKDDDPERHWHLANNPNLHPDAQESIINNAREVAGWHNSNDVLDTDIAHSFAINPSFHPKFHELTVNHSDHRVRQRMAERSDLSPEHQLKLGNDEHPQVRQAILENLMRGKK